MPPTPPTPPAAPDPVDARALVLAHLDGAPVDRLPAMPITMLFAARLAGVPYRRYCTDFRELARAQTLVAERFGFDHVSAISDPCREAVDLGADVTWFDDQPPALDERRALLADPPADLFGLAVRQAIAFARAQVDAGADIVGVGDAAASLVGPAIYREVVLPHERILVDAIHAMGARVRLHICGNTRRSVAAMASLGADLVDIDYPVPFAGARADAGPDQVLLGNLNPVAEVLNATPEAVTAGVAACHAAAGPRYVVGAGCELPAATPHANVDALVAYAWSTRPDGSPAVAG